MIKNWIVSNYEKLVFITSDGIQYNLHDPARKSVLSQTGWGLPPADIADVRGPFQHGTNPLTIRIPPRTIEVNVRHNGCDRDEYWSNRLGLIDALRLNRTNMNDPEPGHLRWYRSDGTIRQADVMIIKGPNFDPNRKGWDEHSYTDELVFLCHNPILYDPSQVNTVFGNLACSILQQLVFPFSFGGDMLVFGGNICLAINTVLATYTGNWQEYPLITITGPATNFLITHSETGLKLSLYGHVIPAGDTVTFDLRYGRKTVTLGSTGESWLGRLTDDSNLGSFAIEPEPVVTGGINTFVISVEDSTVDTQVTFSYYRRWVGI